MTSAFISYRRQDSAALATLIAVRLKDQHGIDAFVDTRNTDGGGPFPERLRRAIEASDVFVCLLGATTLESAWVNEEIEHAHNLRKTMIPVFQERYVAPNPIPNEQVEALLQSDGVQILDVRNIYVDQAINDLAAMIKRTMQSALQPERSFRLPIWLGAAAAIMLLVLAISQLSRLIIDNATPTPPTQVAQGITPDIATDDQPAFSLTPALNNTSTPTRTPRPTFTPVPTLDATQIEASITAEMALIALGETLTIVFNQTATALQWTPVPTADVRATAQARATEARATQDVAQTATQMMFDATATAEAYTDTPTPTPTPTITPSPTVTPTPDPLQAAYAQAAVYDYLSGNEAWIPVLVEFDGVPMMLVPAGCFMMGSNAAGDEQPVHEQCFDAPFWMDQTEVTQVQFARFGGQQANPPNFSGQNRPVENITWFEARDFCERRGMRLPTEREWEYAARGPDALVYPWGDTWNEDNAVWSGNSNSQTVNVGSRSVGASWVGALDMAGNVWEWVNTIYGIDDSDYNFSETGERRYPYPYVGTDGREQDSDDRTFVRVLRGGSWYGALSTSLRGANRYWFNPDNWGDIRGFRCARSS
jgi:formylglycine-generating enzyme required for sulfatase activity